MKLLLLSFLLATSAVAQPGMNEALTMSKPHYGVNEDLIFRTHLFRTRMIPTMSCSCGNTDFYYRVHQLVGKDWILAIDHTEYVGKSAACECKSNLAAIDNNKAYRINGLLQKGKYYVEIGSTEAAVRSAVFEVW